MPVPLSRDHLTLRTTLLTEQNHGKRPGSSMGGYMAHFPIIESHVVSTSMYPEPHV